MIPPGSLQRASQPRRGTKVDSFEDPPTKTPEDVLALLRGEIELKYGSKAVAGVPMGMKRDLRSMVRGAIINTYQDPKVIMSLIRILVWDWEVVRAECWPHRPRQAVPCLRSLVQYHERLAPQISTGFTYSGAMRGKNDTYASRYLDQKPTAAVYEDPWDLG
jgi:hypothetical protein